MKKIFILMFLIIPISLCAQTSFQQEVQDKMMYLISVDKDSELQWSKSECYGREIKEQYKKECYYGRYTKEHKFIDRNYEKIILNVNTFEKAFNILKLDGRVFGNFPINQSMSISRDEMIQSNIGFIFKDKFLYILTWDQDYLLINRNKGYIEVLYFYYM